MGDFFHAGGPGMIPTLLFGFLMVASAVLYVLRPERRHAGLVVALGATTLGSGTLGFCLGLMMTFRYLGQVEPIDQLKIAGMGVEESLHNLVLALILIVLSSMLASIGAFRATRMPSSAAA